MYVHNEYITFIIICFSFDSGKTIEKSNKIYHTNLLPRKFSKCSADVKCHLFETYCSVYCALMWFDCTKTKNEKPHILLVCDVL